MMHSQDMVGQERAAATVTYTKKKPLSQYFSRFGIYLLICTFCSFFLVPFIWMVGSSLKKSNEVFSSTISFFPKEWQWNNYIDIWNKAPFALWIGNSLFLACVVTALQVLTGAFAAYGFSKMRFPGRDVLFLFYIATIAVPWQAYMIPQFKLISIIHLNDTRMALILIQAFNAFAVFMMKQFYETIPEELSEAARIDGLSEYGIFARIMLPLSKPSLAALTIIVFTGAWNDYMGPLIYLRTASKWTIQIGLKSFIGDFQADDAIILVGSVLSVLPVFILFILGQRYFVQGVASSGLKG